MHRAVFAAGYEEPVPGLLLRHCRRCSVRREKRECDEWIGKIGADGAARCLSARPQNLKSEFMEATRHRFLRGRGMMYEFGVLFQKIFEGVQCLERVCNSRAFLCH